VRDIALERIGVAVRLEPEMLEIDGDITMLEKATKRDSRSQPPSIPTNDIPAARETLDDAQPTPTMSMEHDAGKSEGLSRTKRLVSLPNLAFSILIAIAALLTTPEGGSLPFRFGQTLGVCIVPLVLGLAWNGTRKEWRILKWLYVGSIALLLLIFVGAQIQHRKEHLADAPVTEQLKGQQLKGLKRVFVDASVLTRGGDGDDCGLSKSQLETTATFILQQSQLQFVDTKSAAEGVYFVNAQVDTASDGNFCVVSLSTRLESYGTITARYGRFSGWVGGFEEGSLLFGERATVSKRAADQLAVQAKDFVVRWQKDNP